MHSQPTVVTEPIKLKRFATDPGGSRHKRKTKAQTDELCRRLGDAQELLYANGSQTLLLVFQGLDCSGKDGAIRRLLEYVNPAGVQTTSFKAPSEEEKAHDFLWRVHRAVPRYGMIGVFNRSHYEAVLVERVRFGVSAKECRERFEQIVAFERMLAANHVVILKFFLHLSRDEQAERLQARLDDPTKHWKFQRDDLKTRAHWDEFMDAYEDMLNATSHPAARWHVVPADRKWYRDHVIAQAVVRAIDHLKLSWPKRTDEIAGVHIK